MTFVARTLDITDDLGTRQQQTLPARLALELAGRESAFHRGFALLGRGNLILHCLAFPSSRHDPSLLRRLAVRETLVIGLQQCLSQLLVSEQFTSESHQLQAKALEIQSAGSLGSAPA